VTEDLAARQASRAAGIRRVVVAYWLLVVLVALVVRYPEAFRQANQSARANAALDLLDREAGGGNSVIPDQRLLFEARGLIPEDGTFAIALGEPQEGWTDLTAPFAETYLRYFLLPRRVASDSPWVLCFACDRSSYPGATFVWEGDDGLSILNRGS
jgi:hypothetical protein